MPSNVFLYRDDEPRDRLHKLQRDLDLSFPGKARREREKYEPRRNASLARLIELLRNMSYEMCSFLQLNPKFQPYENYVMKL